MFINFFGGSDWRSRIAVGTLSFGSDRRRMGRMGVRLGRIGVVWVATKIWGRESVWVVLKSDHVRMGFGWRSRQSDRSRLGRMGRIEAETTVIRTPTDCYPTQTSSIRLSSDYQPTQTTQTTAIRLIRQLSDPSDSYPTQPTANRLENWVGRAKKKYKSAELRDNCFISIWMLKGTHLFTSYYNSSNKSNHQLQGWTRMRYTMSS